MRTYLVLILILMLIGCAPKLRRIEREGTLYGIDFRKYANEGFLITPYKYDGEYLTMGFVSYDLFPQAVYAIVDRDDVTGDAEYEWKSEEIDMSMALDSIYMICIEMDANALIDFRTEEIVKPYFKIINPVTLVGRRITGYAIKRLDSE